jgi:hypothetical protein
VNIFNRIQTPTHLDVNVRFVFPAQIGIVWHDPLIPDRHRAGLSGVVVEGNSWTIRSAPVCRIAVALENRSVGERFWEMGFASVVDHACCLRIKGPTWPVYHVRGYDIM